MWKGNFFYMNIDEAIEKYNKLSKACNVVFPQTRNYKQMANWLEQLKEYQQLEEQGRLIKLPCKVGDTVYCIENKEIYTCIVEKISISKNNGVWVEISFPKEIPDIVAIEYNSNDMGKIVFLAKTEAETKLEELRGNNNG